MVKQNWIRRLALGLCLGMVLTGAAFASDMGAMPPPPDGGPGGGGPPPMDGAPTEAAIVIADGAENSEAEYTPGAYSAYLFPTESGLVIRDLELISGDYTFNGITVTGSDLRLEKAKIRLGASSPAASDDKGGSAVSLDSGARVFISDSDLIVDGAARYVTAAYNDATLVVNDSLVQSTGSNENTRDIAEPFSNEALLISGTARANFSIGATKTYYYNSTCTAEGWAALSTDSATGSGLDLYAYNTDGIAEHGGYGTYADTNCRVWLYGSRLMAAEIGAIISKSGKIEARSADAADDEALMYLEGDKAETDSSILGGRNAVMIHAPDMMGQGLWAADCGTFIAEDARIATTRDLVSTKDYYDYGDAVGAYIDYVSGSDLLIRSTSATIRLKNVEMDSYNNTLVHTVLNADSMGNFLAPGDGDQVQPVLVQMEDMDVSGDIRHEDYQRNMTVELTGTTLSGNIISGTMERWNETWQDYGEVNWVVDDAFDAVYGVALDMRGNSVWNVTGASSLTSLTVDESSVIHGEITLNGEPLTPEPGVVYTGDITVIGDYTPEPEEPEAEPEPTVSYVVEDDFPPDSLPSDYMDSYAEAEGSDLTDTSPAAPETPRPEPEQSSHAGALVAGIAILAAAGILGGVLVYRKKKQ